LVSVKGVPELRRQWERKVGEYSAILGFIVGLLPGVGLLFEPARQHGEVCFSLLCPFMTAAMFFLAAAVGIALVRGLCESLGWNRKRPNLPPGYTLAKTDSLARRPRERAGETGVLDPDRTSPAPPADREQGVQREDFQPPG
jgi:hypothetical protein